MILDNIYGLIGALVAVGSLILSIYVYIDNRRSKIPRVKAQISGGMLTYNSPRGPNTILRDEYMVLSKASNLGEKKVRITSIYLSCKGKNIVFMGGIEGTTPIPFDLQPGENATFWVPAQQVARTLIGKGITGKQKIKCVFTDATDKTFESESIIMDIDGLAK